MAREVAARCVHCRADISVPDSYAHGDHIKCGACGTQHKVVRGERAAAGDRRRRRRCRRRCEANERDGRRGSRTSCAARARSFGIGANGLGIGVVYVLYQVAHRRTSRWTCSSRWARSWSWPWRAGIVLELAQLLFLAKRQRDQPRLPARSTRREATARAAAEDPRSEPASSDAAEQLRAPRASLDLAGVQHGEPPSCRSRTSSAGCRAAGRSPTRPS